MKALKSIWSVLAGILVIVVLSIVTDLILEKLGVFPPQTKPEAYTTGLLAFALLYRSIYAVIGGYTTAILAPKKPMKHVYILVAIGTVLGILGAAANWGKSAEWYPVSLVITSFFCVLIGGRLRDPKKKV